ncbi:MmpS family transport accessory protein [Actinoplanes sp. NEAU-A12]|uniref:MmpS family transport accessory protein n=1 Tax=Actinoplanes sandaracinus TaxID=3045177 RepID=A0ABT6WFN0_9ACTN|nr:MmpS family transport accessory protein [Actinoplanes sandaracinus]MDI6098510.1 MmpS family transport accessory protein [Actinoplanes sandaracinus]
MSDPSDPSEPRQPPRPPQFTPPDPTSGYPPTAQFPQVGYNPQQPPPYDPATGYPPPYDPATGYPPPYDPATGYPPPGVPGPPPGYEHPQPPPRKSSVPLIALILAVTLLLCGGVVTAGVILFRQATDKAEELAEPILNPTLPTPDVEVPGLPGLPTDFPDLPGLPTDFPTGLPGIGEGKEISVTYEITGDGPAEILYVDSLEGTPKRVGGAKLPWKVTVKVKGTALVSVMAVRTGLGSGSITCRASIDGEQVAEHSAEGTLATANCYKIVVN